MAHHVEPMDIDGDFDNKENSLHHTNVLPFTEKGYEELDVSELNMKLRYSVTPVSSPMSKSCTANCLDNRSLEPGDDTLNITGNDNVNLTRSLNSTVSINDNVMKSLKSLPLQSISDDTRSTSILRPLDTTITPDNGNINITVCGPSDIDENLSLPSSSSSTLDTPEATTPTKDIPKDGGSPIMRGLKSVLNMFRSSQSPIPPLQLSDGDTFVKSEILSPGENTAAALENNSEAVLASTPITAHRKKEMSPTKRSPQKDNSIVFNDDLEKELQWKDETTIIFSQERIPIHKLLLQQPQDHKNANKDLNELLKQDIQDLNSTVEYMDISYNDSIRDKTITDVSKVDVTVVESDSEFVDCETTFTKNESLVKEDNDVTPVANELQDLDLTKEIEKSKNESGSRLKQIILDTTQDILDATLSVRPEDLLDSTKDTIILDQTVNIDIPNDTLSNNQEELPISVNNEPLVDQTINIIKTCTLSGNIDDSNTTRELTSSNNETFDLSRPNTESQQELDVTKTIESDNTTIVLDQTADLNNTLTMTEDSNTTKVITPSNETCAPIESRHENLNITKTINNKLNLTQTLLDKSCTDKLNNILNDKTIIFNETRDLNNTLTYVTNIEDVNTTTVISSNNNETFDVHSLANIESQLASVDIAANVGNTLNTTQTLSNQTINNDTNATPENDTIILGNTTIEVSSLGNMEAKTIEKDLEDIVNKGEVVSTLPEVQVNAVIEASGIDLPADIPLPDEDDLEKEVNTDTIIHTMPVDMSIDIVDEIETTQKADSISEMTTQVSTPDTIISDHKYVEMSIVSESITVQLSNNDIAPSENNIEIEKISLPNEAINIITSQEERLIDKTHTNITNHKENRNIKQNPGEPVIQQVSLSPNNNSVIESKPLPDVINQTTMANADNIETVLTVCDDMKQEIQSTMDTIAINYPKVDNVNEQQINIDSTKNIETAVICSDDAENLSANISTNLINAGVSMDKDNEENACKSEEMNTISPENYSSIIQKEHIELKVETLKENIEAITEEIVLSENNSPFVSIVTEHAIEVSNNEHVEIKSAQEQVMDKEEAPPSSPPIRSKGYNFNFDDLDFNPFATQTKIRMSPPLGSPSSSAELPTQTKSVEKPMPRKENNRRKTQSEIKKRPSAPKRKINSLFDSKPKKKTIEDPITIAETVNIQLDSPATKALNLNNVTIEDCGDVSLDVAETPQVISQVELGIVEEKKIEEPIETIAEVNDAAKSLSIELKTTSSSEQSVYCSAESATNTNSSEASLYKNVFNLPEIDDMNFNPFATKSKMRQSPPPTPFNMSSDMSLLKTQANDFTTLEDKIETELMEKDASGNSSNMTGSSKATDERNITVREIATEDEDTIEGPFLEADDFSPNNEIMDLDKDDFDMMQFNERPAQSNEDNLDNGEMFIDAEAFEFLLNQNKCNTIVDSGKESLFLKFDPLFAKRMSSITSENIVASLAKVQKRQSTPTKTAQSPPKNISVPGTSKLNTTQDTAINASEEFNDDLNITVSKPMMVVPPAVNSVTPRNKSLTPNRSNRRSITFTSPAMAVIDRLLSLSGNNSMIHETTVTQVSREQNEADVALSQLRELLAEKEINAYTLRSESNELKDRLSSLESQLTNLEAEGQARLKKINQLTDTLAEKTDINKRMAGVVEEYERTIASLINEIAQDKKKHEEERIKLISERDEQTAHLASMEVSFSDLHSKYEKSKQIILNCKANEDTYKKSIADFEKNLAKIQNNYELLKQHATSKLVHANQELEKINRSHEAEVLKLNAMMKRKELHISSLEESLAQKTKANEELTAICDELINKVG